MATSDKVLVLLVEDEPLVRLVASESLADAGYDVVEAQDAAEALKIVQTRADVGVLFTDVNMPGELDGLGLADLIHACWPDIHLVVTSGRPLPRPVPDEGAFLPKPYSQGQLTRAIREVRGEV